MKTFITSDLHFSHKNILTFQMPTREFDSIEVMNEWLIQEWNARVSYKDVVYILGDVAFGPVENAIALVSRLVGNKILVKGNHDHKNLKSPDFANLFMSVHDYLEIKYDRKTVCMFHFPIARWNKKQHGSIMLHGHCHGHPVDVNGRIMDVGYDATGQVVSLLDDVIDTVMNKDASE